MRRELRALLTAVLLYSLFYGAFFLRSLLSGNYIAPSDSLDFGVADYLARPALWSQGIWSGYPVAADPQALTWYPLLRLFRALNVDWNVFLISAYVVTSSTCFLLVRRMTRSSLAGAFAGLVCGFNVLMVGYITNFNQLHAFAWVPLMLYGLQLVREEQYGAGATVTAAGEALMWLAGHPQVPVYASYLAAAFVLGTLAIDRPARRTRVTRLLWSAAGIGLGLGLAAIMLVPMIELQRFSPRVESSWELYASSALPPRELLTLIAPFAFGGFFTESGSVPYVGKTGDSGYVGILALALAAAAPIVLRRFRGDARLWTGIGVIELLLSLGPATPIGMLFFYAPGYSVFQAPLRHLFLVALCVATASGLVVAELAERRVLARVVAIAVAALTVAGLVALAVSWRAPDIRALVDNPVYIRWSVAWPLVPAIALLLVALVARRLPDARQASIAFGAVLMAIQVADLLMVHYRWPGRRFEYADVVRDETVLHHRMAALRDELDMRGERVLATDGSKNPFLLPNLTRPWEMPAASGTGSLAISNYIDVLGMDTSGAVSNRSLSDANHGVDLFGVRYALVRQDSEMSSMLKQDAGRWQPVEDLQYYESDPDTFYTLFRNNRALPRAWCVPRLIGTTVTESLDAIHDNRLRDGSAFDPAKTALIESPLPAAWNGSGESAQAATVRIDRTNGETRYVVKTVAPCMLVMGEVYYPWWRAALDETPVDTYRVNHAMLGVVVPPGSHLVRLWMLPLSVWIGAAISGLSLLVWLAAGSAGFFRTRRGNGSHTTR